MIYYLVTYNYKIYGGSYSESKGLVALPENENLLSWFASNSPHGYKIAFVVKIKQERFEELRQQRVRDLREDFSNRKSEQF